MSKVTIRVIGSLQVAIEQSDQRTQKLFEKQKRFMEDNPYHPSLGRTKLTNVIDKYGNNIWEVRLDGKRRIAYVERNGNDVIWLKICSHDELKRNQSIHVRDSYISDD